MLSKRLIKSNDAGGGGCTNTVDLYNPFPDGGGLALYQLNGDATDVSGNYNGTASNVTYGAGEFGQAGVFNGSSSKITIPNGGIISSSGGFAISFWLKWNGDADYAYLFQFGNQGGQSFYTILHDSSDTLYWGVTNGGYGSSISVGYSVAERSVWTNFVISWDGTTNVNAAKIYKNGALAIEGTQTKSQPNIGNQEYLIGNNGAEWFNGELDQLRFFNRALRPYEVEALYTEEYCTPTIVPSKHFNTITYTGNGTTQSITGVGFQPDFTWIKVRTVTDNNVLQDSVRGVGKGLFSDLTNAENASMGGMTSFDSDGFTFDGSISTLNGSGRDFVSWNFKAGGAAVTNTDGTITSQVSANTEAGFSIVKYFSNFSSSNSASVGHGLTQAPQIIISKGLDTTSNWRIRTNTITGSPYDFLEFDTGSIGQLSSSDGTLNMPTDTKFDVNWNSSIGASGNTIAYCFAEVEGFSNFGSFIGTGTTEGNFVVTGFEPAFVMWKKTSNATSAHWNIVDNKRSPLKDKNNVLYSNLSSAEDVTSYDLIDFHENGFQVKAQYSQFNESGATFIYMAFAADPTTVEPTLEDSFNTVLYTSTGGSQSVTGLGFQPDLLWTKNRTATWFHQIVDSVRGLPKTLYSNSTQTESIPVSYSQSLDSDGFTVNYTETIGSNYVAWAWKGAEIPAINSNGSIPSVVSANPAAGFSISTYSGKTGGGTTGHGLNSEPEFIIFKRYTAAQNWFVFAKINNVWHSFEGLNTTATAVNYSPYFSANDSIINWYNINEYNSDPASKYLAYSFHSVAGFSKFGSYSGDGTNNASNIQDIGFEPAFLLIKSSNVSNNWEIFDNKRSPANPNNKILKANTTDSEATYTYGFNFLNNGFVPENIWFNGIGETFIYMAFANQF